MWWEVFRTCFGGLFVHEMLYLCTLSCGWVCLLYLFVLGLASSSVLPGVVVMFVVSTTCIACVVAPGWSLYCRGVSRIKYVGILES